MAADGTIDKLVIKVSADAEAASRSLKSVASALSRMEQATKGGMSGLTSAAVNIRALNSSLKGGSFSKLSALASGLSELSAAARSANGSFTGVQGLASALSSLQSVKGGGVKSMVSALSSMPAALEGLSGIDASATARLASLSSALGSMSGLKAGGLRSIVSQLSEMPALANKLRAMDATVPAKIRQLASAMQGFGDVKAGGMATVIKRLGELPAVVRQYQGLDFASFEAQVKTLTASLNSLATAVGRLGAAYSTLPTSLKTISSASRSVASANTRLEKASIAAKTATAGGGTAMSAAAKDASTFAGKLKELGKPMQAIRSLWQGLKFSILDIVGGALSQTVGAASTYVEDMNLARTVMGSAFQSESDFWKKVQNAYSIDSAEALKYQGVFEEMISGMGIGTEAATKMSRTLTQLGYDLTSFENFKDVSTAMEKIQSGVSGNSLEPMRQIGFDLSIAKIDEDRDDIAAATGIDKSSSEMSQAEKVAARYYEMISQVTESHGDLGRTLTSPANQLRILQSQFAILARNVGGMLLPALSAVVPVLIAIVKAAQSAVASIATLFGIAGLDSYFAALDDVDYSSMEGGLGDATEAADDAGSALSGASDKAKEFKKQLLGFDQINNITDTDSDSGSGGGGSGSGGGGAGAGAFKVPTYDWDLTSQIDATLDKLKGLWNMASAAAFAVKGIQIAKSLLPGLKAAKKELVELAGKSKALEKLKALKLKVRPKFEVGDVAKLGESLKLKVGKSLSKLSVAFDESKLGKATKALRASVAAKAKKLKLAVALTAELGKFTLGSKASAAAKAAGGAISKALGGAKNVIKGLEGPLKVVGELFKFPALGTALKGVGKFVPVLGEVLIAVDLIKGAFDVVKGAIEKLQGTGVFEKLQDSFSQIKSAIDEAFGGGSGFEDFVAQATDFASTVLAEIITEVADIIAAVTPFLTDVISFLGSIFDIVSSIIEGDWSGAAEGAKSAFSSLWSFISRIFGGIGQWFLERGNDIVSALSGIPAAVGGLFAGAWSLASGAFGAVKSFFAEKASQVVAALSGVPGKVGGFFKSAFAFAKSAFAQTKATFAKVATTAISAFTKIPGKIGGFFKSAFKNAKSAVSGLPQWLKEHVVDKVVEKFTSLGSRVGDTFGGAIKGAINSVIGTIESKLNAVIGVAKKIPVLGSKIGDLTISLPRLATGGTISTGQMFVAREAGPELVGQVGSKTGVMNNSQIVDAVSAGVARAVAQAITTTAGGSSSKTVNLSVNLDGRQIIKSINGAQRRAGKVLLEV